MKLTPGDLKRARKIVVGSKQTLKAIDKEEALAVFFARDAEEKVINPVINMCKEKGIDCSSLDTMAELGRCCGIKVGAAAAAIVDL